MCSSVCYVLVRTHQGTYSLAGIVKTKEKNLGVLVRQTCTRLVSCCGWHRPRPTQLRKDILLGVSISIHGRLHGAY